MSDAAPSGEGSELGRRVRHVTVLDGYRLRLRFDDGVVGEVDIAHRLRFEGVFAPLRDPRFFRKVRIEGGTICWPNEVDLDPDVLYCLATGRRVPDPGDPTAVRYTAAPAPALPSADTAPGASAEVPEICRFMGIVIKMYFDDHWPPHFHVEYNDKNAVVSIETLGILAGSLPGRILGLVVEWGTLHRPELLDNWDRARQGRRPTRIAPLE